MYIRCQTILTYMYQLTPAGKHKAWLWMIMSNHNYCYNTHRNGERNSGLFLFGGLAERSRPLRASPGQHHSDSTDMAPALTWEHTHTHTHTGSIIIISSFVDASNHTNCKVRHRLREVLQMTALFLWCCMKNNYDKTTSNGWNEFSVKDSRQRPSEQS